MAERDGGEVEVNESCAFSLGKLGTLSRCMKLRRACMFVDVRERHERTMSQLNNLCGALTVPPQTYRRTHA